MKESIYSQREYNAPANEQLVQFVDTDGKLLDVGCGTGTTGKLLTEESRDRTLFGITLSEKEAQSARKHYARVWVQDIEREELPADLFALEYEAVLFSHVLEHLRWPWDVLHRICGHLKAGCDVYIAVPNIVVWDERINFLSGSFDYEERGKRDITHLRFFTINTAVELLINKVPSLDLVYRTVVGHCPLGAVRRPLELLGLTDQLDRIATSLAPSLFGHQIFLKAKVSRDHMRE